VLFLCKCQVNFFYGNIKVYLSLSWLLHGNSRLQIFHGHKFFKTATFTESSHDYSHLATLLWQHVLRSAHCTRLLLRPHPRTLKTRLKSGVWHRSPMLAPKCGVAPPPLFPPTLDSGLVGVWVQVRIRLKICYTIWAHFGNKSFLKTRIWNSD
jgi:hypothetical protein